MKIRVPIPVGLLTALLAILLRIYLRMLRVRCGFAWQGTDPRASDRGYIYCLWHETMLLPAYLFAGQGIHVLISQSKDGEYIAQVVERLGFATIRGSTSRGAVKALRGLLRVSQRSSLAITPDGPRGPRQEFQPGAVYLASRTGLPLVPMGVVFHRPWRANSWDRFIIPKPFSRAACYFGQPLVVPADADAQQLMAYQELANQAMQQAMEEAEHLLRLGKAAEAVSSNPGPVKGNTGVASAQSLRVRHDST